MLTLHAQPYDMTAKGFFFTSVEEFELEAGQKRNRYGISVKEFEIRFVDGDRLDAALSRAFDIQQEDIAAYFRAVCTWSVHQKLMAIIAIKERGDFLMLESCNPKVAGVKVLEARKLRDMAGRPGKREWRSIACHERLVAPLAPNRVRAWAAGRRETTIAGWRVMYRFRRPRPQP